ncbi:MAG TPA: hypothetical protein VF868_07820 [Bacteroidia bacterium]|jgi:hypothetical protein
MKDTVIHLKNGKKKHGFLIDTITAPDNYLFIPYESAACFSETQNTACIEVVPGVLIEAIETDLK